MAIKCTLYEARDEVTQEVTADNIITFKNPLETSSHLFSILPEVDTDVTFTGTQFGLVPQGSVLSCHLPVMSTPSDIQPPELVTEQLSHSQPQTVIDAGKQMLPFCDHVNCTLLPMAVMSLNESRQTEQATLGQHNCDLWKEYHTVTLTSSDFKCICSQEKSISDSFVGSFLIPPDLSHLPTIQYGRYYEGVAASSYLAMHVNNGIPISMRTCGLVLHTKYKFLGASPDCLVNVTGSYK